MQLSIPSSTFTPCYCILLMTQPWILDPVERTKSCSSEAFIIKNLMSNNLMVFLFVERLEANFSNGILSILRYSDWLYRKEFVQLFNELVILRLDNFLTREFVWCAIYWQKGWVIEEKLHVDKAAQRSPNENASFWKVGRSLVGVIDFGVHVESERVCSDIYLTNWRQRPQKMLKRGSTKFGEAAVWLNLQK